MTRRQRTFARPTVDAAAVLGTLIARARRERKWTAAELAERVGVSAATIASLERGSTSVALGTAFEAATVVGVPLFSADPSQLTVMARREQETLALLPRRVRHRTEPEHDDF